MVAQGGGDAGRPDSRTMVITRLRGLTVTRGGSCGASLRAVLVEAGAPHPVEPVPDARWPPIMPASWASLAWVMVGEVTA